MTDSTDSFVNFLPFELIAHVNTHFRIGRTKSEKALIGNPSMATMAGSFDDVKEVNAAHDPEVPQIGEVNAAYVYDKAETDIALTSHQRPTNTETTAGLTALPNHEISKL